MNDRAATSIEKVLAHPTIAGTPTLPSPNAGQGVLHCHAFTQLSAPLRGLLARSQFDEESFIRVDADAAPFRAGRALCLQRTLSARLFREMDDSTWLKRHFLLSWTADRSSIQSPAVNACFEKCFPSRTGQALQEISRSSLRSRTRWLRKLRPVDMEFFQRHVLPLHVSADRFGDAGFWQHSQA